MDFAIAEPLVRAVLYEGYVLYPYRASSLKNQRRWTFGGLYPPAWSATHPDDRSSLRAEVLVAGDASATVGASLRFLQLDGEAWQRGTERRVDVEPRAVGALVENAARVAFRFGSLEGELVVSARPVERGVVRLCVVASNRTESGAEDRGRTLGASLASAHVLVGAKGAELVSCTDPPAHLRAAADRCKNVGVWPVLVGPRSRRDVVLASPIILEDHAQIAPESPGDLFDATEIDEILTLRILTLTDAEKAEVRATDPRARAVLDRVEALGPDALVALHGTLRARGPYRPGARVRLHPKRRADVLDLALDGRAATIASVEQDYEGALFVAVTVDDDPGRDLGAAGFPGHRFFFRTDEVELLP